MNSSVRMNQPLISENMRSCLTGIHVCMTLLSPRFACGEVCSISSLPGGEACCGHVCEYAFVKSSMKEEELDPGVASMRLRVVEAFEIVDVRARLSPATLGRKNAYRYAVYSLIFHASSQDPRQNKKRMKCREAETWKSVRMSGVAMRST